MFAWALAYCLWLLWVKNLTRFPWELLKINVWDWNHFLSILPFGFLNKKLQSIWFTFSLMNILNIYRLDFVVQWSVWYFFDWIRSVAFQLLCTFNSSSAILKNYQAFSLALRYCSWHSYGDAHETQDQT